MDLLAPVTDAPRQAALHRYGLPGVEAEPELQALVRAAAVICDVPTATLNLLDVSLQRNYTTVGFAGGECARDTSMCATALREGGALHVRDASSDPRFTDNPWVTGELARIRMYASSPLRAPSGVAFGTLCVFDEAPRRLTSAQLAALDDLAGVVVALLERRRLAHQAEAESAAKSAFLAAVSHEVRTPLQGVLAMLDLVRAETRPPDALSALQQERAGVAQRSAETLLGLLDGVLDLSKGEAGQVQLAPRPFDPRVLVDDVVQVLRAVGTRKDVPLRWRVEGVVPDRVLADPERVRQVLVNLVGNAVKFTPSGSVEVVLAGPAVPSADGAVVPLRLVVRDTGEGIGPDDLAHLFDPYAQGAAGRRHGGTGLGLAITRSLVELMGGSVTVDSALGVGTTFTVHLPVPPAQEPVPDRPVTHEGLRVLVADDDAVGRLVTGALLESFGAHAVTVEDGAQALAAALSPGAGFDVVLLDHEMPGLSGPETAARLRASGVRVPLVALTGRTAAEDVQACLDAGMTEVLRKPVRPDELSAALGRVVARADRSAAVG